MAVVMALLLKFFIVEAYKIPTGSMQPTLIGDERSGIKDRILVDKLSYVLREPRRWEVAVFRYPLDRSKNFVKRIVGLPGDRIRIQEGAVFVNGVPLAEPYVEHPSADTLSERTVPADSYFVLGDNRAQSDDSRHWGPVPRENVIGKVWVAYWPLANFAALWTGVR